LPLRTLIVDDHASFRAIARKLLVEAGLDVVGEAPDGASALAAARELRPDCVLLDVQLPDIDGFEVASALAAGDDGPAVVMTSTRDVRDFAPLLRHSPVRGFIAKESFSPAGFLALVT
jgi:two-component system response regulator EvgA